MTTKVYPCAVCGADMGWRRPSGVCSEACLREAQGLPPVATIHCDECWAEVAKWADYPGGVKLCLTCDGLERWTPLVPPARAHNP